MSEDAFLSRWSRLKRAAEKPAPPAEETPAPEDAVREAAPPPEPQGTLAEAVEELDLSALPSLESITGTTDVTGFLQRGVPEELRRSALRKAWSSDPAIRDFIGLSENAWDFNDPNAIPGFGPLDISPEQVRHMAQKLVGAIEDAAERIESVGESAPAEPTSADTEHADAQLPSAGGVQPAAMQQEIAAVPEADVAVRDEPEPAAAPLRPRRHGGALPQ